MGDVAVSRVKVLHVIARMNVGGPAVEIVELLRGIDPAVVSQTLVTGSCGADERDYLDFHAPDLAAIRVKGFGRRINLAEDVSALIRLIRIIHIERPDIVHTHTAKAGILGRIAAKIAHPSCKIIHTYHGHLLSGYFGPSMSLVVRVLERALSRITDHFVVVGAKVKEDLLSEKIGCRDAYSVVHTGVTMTVPPGNFEARKELGLAAHSIVVSLIGRLTQIKRPDRFAEVAEILHNRSLGIHFLVAGGGDQEEWLRQRVKDLDLPVTMLGWRDDLECILAATDIVLLTSDNEGAPLSLIEAAQVGIPAVATNVGSVAEVVLDELSGILTPQSVQAMADGVERLARDPRLRAEMGRRAQAHIRSNYSLESFIKSHEAIYSAYGR